MSCHDRTLIASNLSKYKGLQLLSRWVKSPLDTIPVRSWTVYGEGTKVDRY